MLKLRSKIIACDSETTGLNPYGSPIQLGRYPDRPFAFSFTTYEGEDHYIRFRVNPYNREVMYQEDWASYQWLKEFFDDESRILVFHNANFDLGMLRHIGIHVRGESFDTKLLAHVADSSRMSFSLKPLTKAMFGFPDEDLSDLKDSVKKARRAGKKLGYALAEDVEADYALGDPELCKKYACGDTQRTMKLFKAYEPLLTEKQHSFSPYSHYAEIVEMEHALLPIVAEMSRTGVAIDLQKVAELASYYRQCITKANTEKAALGYSDLNPNSPQQLQEVFYDTLGLKPEYRKRKAEDGTKTLTKTCDKRVIEKWSKTVPLAKSLLELSEASHQLDSFIIPFKEGSFSERGNRVLHPSYNTCGPVTGRLSCSSPNLQNITSSTSPGRKSEVEFRARECFVPRPGTLWLLCDYSQVEIWVAAFSSKDPLMCETLLAGKSVHDLTCDKVFGHKPDFTTNRAMYRKMAKIVNFSMLYGSGPKALSELLGIPESEAKEYWQAYWDTYTGIQRYNEALKRQVRTDGFVKDCFNRPYFVEAKFAYKALNYIVQGGAAGILKRAMLNTDAYVKSKGFKMLLTVHDELVFECPESSVTEEIVRGIVTAMQGDFHERLGMPNPFEIDVSIARDNWNSKEKYV